MPKQSAEIMGSSCKERDIHRGIQQLNIAKTRCFSATFIIDRDGILRQSSFYDPKIGRSVEETVRLLKAIQGVDQQKEVVA